MDVRDDESVSLVAKALPRREFLFLSAAGKVVLIVG
jgi:hypothetical protein